MSDCVDREAVITVIGDWLYDLTRKDTYNDVINALPAVEPERPKWIPVSERLPEEGVEVLVTRNFLGSKLNNMPSSVYVEVATYECGTWYADSDEFKIGRHTEPIAWMPLPEPYKKGEGD